MATNSQAASIDDRKEQRKLQNRLNQRAHRQRLKLNKPREPKQPYSIHRWRLAEDDGSRLQPSSGFQKFDGHCSENTASEEANTLAVATKLMRFRPSNVPLSSFDRAITRPPTHIIGRGYLANKTVLNHAGDYIDAILNPPLSPKAATECGIAVIRPGRHVIPSSLLPTRLQMNVPHPTWIDMLPFSRMRDNLIRHQYMFDHKSFLMDLIGELVHVLSLPGEETSALKDSTQTYRREDGNGNASFRNGLNLQGDPHMKESWEATPYFLRKWAWVVEGCDDLIEISNRWRMSRGEISLRQLLHRERVVQVH